MKLILKLTFLLIALTCCKANHYERLVRTKRDSKLSAAVKTETVTKHNSYRAMQNSSNMEELTWDTDLADAAQAWAEACDYEHGQPSSAKYKSVGQNLYITSGTATLVRGTQLWYDEIKDYTYSTVKCATGKVCGHYTQVVWATSNTVGCAIHKCASLKDGTNTKTNIEYVVCNYRPQGNYVGSKPFWKGGTCQACPAHSPFCRNNLCSKCKTGSSGCSCKRFCMNCGELDTNTCSCKCKPGFTGVNCADVCKNSGGDTYCNGFYTTYCSDPKYKSGFRDKCALRCSDCEGGDFDASKCAKAPVDNGNDGGVNTGGGTTLDCTSFACKNSGKPEQSGDKCVCKCSSSNYGRFCQKTVRQLKFGIRLKLKMSLSKWPNLWSIIQNKITTIVNNKCRKTDTFGRCCKGKTIKAASLATYDILKPNELSVAAGFPEQDESNSAVIKAMLIAKPALNNDLCTKGSVAASLARKKRETDEDFMPQEVLLEAVNEAKSEIESAAKSCCDATLEGIEKPDINEALGGGSNSVKFGIFTMVVSVLVAFGLIN